MTTLCQTIKNYCSLIHFILKVDFHQLDEEINSFNTTPNSGSVSYHLNNGNTTYQTKKENEITLETQEMILPILIGSN